MLQEELVRVIASISSIAEMPLSERVHALNALKRAMHEVSPFAAEPVDCVEWVLAELVEANDYNPNSVAPPEMELLRLSIEEDGYTQPIVTMPEGAAREVIDGFHRHRVGKECDGIRARVHGYLPVVTINADRSDKSDRMASTIRHNRARGEHKVEAMSDIVVELKRRFWSDEKIAKELGMEPDEVLRLQQVTGLSGLFSDREFSEAWEAEPFADEGEQINEEEIQESLSPMGAVRGVRVADVEGCAPDGAGHVHQQVSLIDD
jgi:ParB-like chromosome segregation protein Spo0J